MRAVFLLLLLAGCAQQTPLENKEVDMNGAADRAQGDIETYGSNTANGTTTPASAANDAAPLTPAEPGQPGGLPDDKTPLSEAPAAPGSGQDAAGKVQLYYALLGEAKYRDAWALWGDKGTESGMSADAFVASFAKYSEYHANVGGPGRVEGAAGQRFVSVPVQVYGRLNEGGRPFYLRGEVVLHRVGEVDGATADQKAWHIKSIDLMPAPGKPGAEAPAIPATPVSVAARYRCMDGNKVAVRYDHKARTATLSRAGRQVATLDQQVAASGIWYRRGAYELRGKGDAATLTTPGQPPIACTVIR